MVCQTKGQILTVEDGLSQGFVTAILQDKDGFLWIGTRDGLNRYDGYQFEHFYYDPLDSFSISGNQIQSICEIGNYLAVSTDNIGLNVFDKKTNRFYRLSAPGELGRWLATSRGLQILTDAADQLWCKIVVAKDSVYLAKIEWETAVDGRLLVQSYQWWPVDRFFRIGVSENGQFVWAGNGKELLRFDVSANEMCFFHTPQPGLSKIAPFNDGTAILSGSKGLGHFDGSKWLWQNSPLTLRDLAIFEQDREMYIATNPGGILRYPLSGASPFKPNLTAADSLTLPGKGLVHYFYKDHSGILWAGTNGYGVLKFNPRQQHFKIYKSGQSIINEHLWIDQQGHLAFNSFSEKDWPGPSREHALQDFPLPMNKKMSCKPGPEGKEWALVCGTHQISLFRKDALYTSWYQLPYSLFSETQIGSWLIEPTFDEEGNLWIAHDYYLKKIDPQTGRFQQFDYRSTLPQKHTVNALAKTGDGSWWIATEWGLLRALPRAKGFSFHLFKPQAGQANSILYDYVSALLIDPKDPQILWIATVGGGLTRMDVRNDRFTHYNTKNGLPNNIIYTILSDRHGRLWMSSNKGIISFDPTSGTIRNYTKQDGLPSNEFNVRAVGQAPDGTMYFGGIKGLVAFHPEEIIDNPTTPTVRFTGLEVNNRVVTHKDSTHLLPQSIAFTENIELAHYQNSLSLEFAGLEFSIPTKNKFRYYLEGAEAPWIHETTEHRATYLNLSPGDYTFRVLAANSDGVWHQQSTNLHLRILPPWWKTTAAYITYLLLLLALTYAILRFFLHRQQLQHRIALDAKEAERLKELDAFKTRLYTNITHEFRTPLTVINGMAEELEDHLPASIRPPFEQAINRGLRLIRQNGEKLLRLINQILDLAKLEERSLPIHRVEADIVPLMKYLTGSFQTVAESKDIQLIFQANTSSVIIPIDKEYLQTIVTNLLSNALKFTPEGGMIQVVLTVQDLNNKLQLSISDSGVGIPADQLPFVFDRFYQADNHLQVEGTGIGLALTKELVEYMGGTISAVSAPDRGTTFTIVFPSPITTGNGTSLSSTTMDPDSSKELTAVIQPKTDQPTLLIVEDNADITEYLLHCLAGEYRILSALNGRSGIELALEQVPDLIVSDVMMPEKDGFELVEVLKNDERTSHVPIVLLTAKADDLSRIKGLERGADAYLAKPFNKKELQVRLRKLLELRQKLQERFAAGNWQLEPDTTTQTTASDNSFELEDAFIKKVQTTVHTHLSDEDFGTRELCWALGVSRTQLHNKLKALTGKSTSLYIRSLRLQKARVLLLSTDRNVSEVASEVGFKYVQHFSTFYTEEFGEPPSRTREVKR
ncbi:MAG: helix-turn-helix domain-containing protein [Lewinella sp.]|nr:helix-turn-helix domain-containing protein [Lewinella sp.]